MTRRYPRLTAWTDRKSSGPRGGQQGILAGSTHRQATEGRDGGTSSIGLKKLTTLVNQILSDPATEYATHARDRRKWLAVQAAAGPSPRI